MKRISHLLPVNVEVPSVEECLLEVASEACLDQMEDVQKGGEVAEEDLASCQKVEVVA